MTSKRNIARFLGRPDRIDIVQIDEFDHAVKVNGKKIGKVFAWAKSGYGAKLTRGMTMSPKFGTVQEAASWLIEQFDQWTSDKALLIKQIRGGK